MSNETDNTIQTLTNNVSYDVLMEQFGSKSNVIRYLHSKGWSRGSIAKFMNIRYQHVRNVLITPLKRDM